ncbi:MAG: D-alanyl-D-alanine carboxypeptidase family protein, partial [Halofilum sp. (in: g-proteobacteria)]
IAPAAAAAPVPQSPSISGASHILMAAETGKVLAAEDADERRPPASLTKIMTAYVVYRALEDESITLEDEVTVSEAAWRMGGSQMFLEVDTQVSVEQLLDGLVVQSGNDAALSLAEHVAGSEAAFVEQMNHYSGELGLEDTNFVNAEGMPHEDHYSTARDLAELSRALIREFPEHYERYSKRSFTYNNIKQYNRNDLLWSDSDVDGLKTGYTRAAGYCLASSAKRDGMRLISIVLNAPSDDQRSSDTRSLLSWGFRFYRTHQLYAADDVLQEARIWNGAHDTVALGLDHDLLVTIPRDAYEQLDARMSFPGRLIAPADEGAELGEVQVVLGEETVARAPLVALEAVGEGTFFQRMADTVVQWFQ